LKIHEFFQVNKIWEILKKVAGEMERRGGHYPNMLAENKDVSQLLEPVKAAEIYFQRLSEKNRIVSTRR